MIFLIDIKYGQPVDKIKLTRWRIDEQTPLIFHFSEIFKDKKEYSLCLNTCFCKVCISMLAERGDLDCRQVDLKSLSKVPSKRTWWMELPLLIFSGPCVLKLKVEVTHLGSSSRGIRIRISWQSWSYKHSKNRGGYKS